MALMDENFQPSDRYIVMSREKYNELKLDLERIRTAITIQSASDVAERVLEQLKKKYDRPAYADALKAELEKKSERAAQG